MIVSCLMGLYGLSAVNVMFQVNGSFWESSVNFLIVITCYEMTLQRHSELSKSLSDTNTTVG